MAMTLMLFVSGGNDFAKEWGYCCHAADDDDDDDDDHGDDDDD